MSTLYQVIHDRLVANGLWPDEAAAVMDKVKAVVGPPMKGRWEESSEAYSPVIPRVLWIGAKLEAVKWIDENKPKHWAREMFVEPEPEAALPE